MINYKTDTIKGIINDIKRLIYKNVISLNYQRHYNYSCLNGFIINYTTIYGIIDELLTFLFFSL